MCRGNLHTSRPHSCGGWCALLLGYFPSLIAVGVVCSNTLPYHLVFLPILRQAYQNGAASWMYYAYCRLVMVFSEVMVYGCFALTVFTPPGYVPHNIWSAAPCFDGEKYSDTNPFEVRQLDRVGRLRYCIPCEQFKPDYVYHCSCCARCVYRMDHHCPWVNNCVGRDNAKFFLLFLSYIPVGAFHIVLTTACSCVRHLTVLKGSIDASLDEAYPLLVLVFSVLMSTMMGISFCCFAIHFLSMMLRGQTSVSRHIALKGVVSPVDRATERESQMYDIFGCDRRWWKAILPFTPQRDSRGLVDETLPSLLQGLGKLV